MGATELLASSLGRKDDEPNKELAREIIRMNRTDWVAELASHVDDQDKNIQSDCLKVLYEIAEHGNPELIAPYWEIFIDLLVSKNNRLVWGAMTALDMMTLLKPKEIYSKLRIVEEGIRKGSVITIDHGVGVLAQLASFREFRKELMPKLIHELARCPIKQLPQYLERSQVAFCKQTKEDFLGIIEIRSPELERDSQVNRVVRIRKILEKI